MLIVQQRDELKLSPLGDQAVILAFGDSLTAGYGTTPEYSYPSVLDRSISQKVINAGVSGETTTQGLARFQGVLDQYQPDLVLLMEGGNDILRNQDLTRTKDNLATMIEAAQSRQIQVILIAVPQRSLTLSAPAFYSELAEEYNLVLEEDLIRDLITQPELKSDQIHFNRQGYARLAEALRKLLISTGAISVN
jgi:acyl-CoA thioesterase-1